MNTAPEPQKMLYDGVELWSMKTGADGLVTIQAGFPVGSMHVRSKVELETMCEMILEGTDLLDKMQIRTYIEERGAELSFFTRLTTTGFVLRALKADAPLLVRFILGVARSASFPEKELRACVSRQMAAYTEQETDTAIRAHLAYDQHWYAKGHAHYEPGFTERRAELTSLTSASLAALSSSIFGRGRITVALAGDIDRTLLHEIVNCFEELPLYDLLPIVNKNQRKSVTGDSEDIRIPDKASVDVIVGMPLDILSTHQDFLPLSLGTRVLGGNFTSRLVAEIREKRGLTYHVHSSISGATKETGGDLLATGSYSPLQADSGTKLMRQIITHWTERGISARELAAKKQEMLGRFVVSLSTTKGYAETLFSMAMEGREPSYIREYQERIKSLTQKEVNRAIREHVDPKLLTIARSGTFERTVATKRAADKKRKAE